METNEVMIDIGKPEDEHQPKKDDNGARFGILFNIYHTAQYAPFSSIQSTKRNFKIENNRSRSRIQSWKEAN